MKSLSIISYTTGGLILLISCFTTGLVATWITSCMGLAILIFGCVTQILASSPQKTPATQKSYVRVDGRRSPLH